MRKKIISIILLLSVLLVACSNNSADEDAESKVDESQDIKEVVNDYSTGNFTDQTASITGTQLIVTEDDEESVYDLPEDEFFVSIAPFQNETHPCEIHSLTGCQGELDNVDFDVYIEDVDGNVIHDETMNSESNGFIDLWLPRENTYNVKISHEGKSVESEISTYENDFTCITTMQLS